MPFSLAVNRAAEMSVAVETDAHDASLAAKTTTASMSGRRCFVLD